MSLPAQNATVTKIVGPGGSEDWSTAATAGTPGWEGRAPAYVLEQTITSTAAGRLDIYGQTSIIVPADLSPSVLISPGDTVEFTYANANHSRRVADVRAHLGPGVRSVRLTLVSS